MYYQFCSSVCPNFLARSMHALGQHELFLLPEHNIFLNIKITLFRPLFLNIKQSRVLKQKLRSDGEEEFSVQIFVTLPNLSLIVPDKFSARLMHALGTANMIFTTRTS